MQINIKPLEKSRVYETAEQAIQHLFLHGVFSSKWQTGKPFGHTMTERRAIDAAIKAKDYSAFKASRRRGYWLIELS